MPYKCIPQMMLRELITQSNTFLNAFGSAQHESGPSPRNLVDNLPHIDYNNLKYKFGEYVQLHVTDRTTNTMRSRTVDAIVCGPRNISGRYNFMSLETGKEINGRVVARLPVTDAVIARVETLGREQNQPYRHSKMLTYQWRPGRPIGDEDVVVLPTPVDTTIIPAPIVQPLPNPGPNPFAVPVTAAPTGADVALLEAAQEAEETEQHENGSLGEDEQEAPQYGNQGAEDGGNQGGIMEGNQGAPLDENQGAPLDENQGAEINGNQGAPLDENQGVEAHHEAHDENDFDNFDLDNSLEPLEEGEEEIVFVEDSDSDTEDEINDRDTDKDELDTRKEERRRRSQHLKTHTGETTVLENERGRELRKAKGYHFYRSLLQILRSIRRKSFSNLHGTSIIFQVKQTCWKHSPQGSFLRRCPQNKE
ncbi:unnamed protein product [Cylindrotheca closterium]|uniref:Uncharacterized protein n=1 Tax=Cylindrotheca closterium TaxID=2856 RepID=A0AAD2FM72_9STRA|nr:unnamed protein product [Cylindrotheca closterium]